MTEKNAKRLMKISQDMENYGEMPFGASLMLCVTSWNEAEFCLLERVRKFIGTKFNSNMTLQELCEHFGVLDQTELNPELLEQ